MLSCSPLSPDPRVRRQGQVGTDTGEGGGRTGHQAYLPGADPVSPPSDLTTSSPSTPSPCSEVATCFRWATWNVESLKPRDDNHATAVQPSTLGVSGRRLALATQLKQAGIRIIGIQEARGRLSGISSCQGFTVIASAGVGGRGGVEL